MFMNDSVITTFIKNNFDRTVWTKGEESIGNDMSLKEKEHQIVFDNDTNKTIHVLYTGNNYKFKE